MNILFCGISKTRAWSSVCVLAAAFGFCFSSTTVMGAELCGQTVDADICIMIDRTGSTNASELGEQRDAVTDLLAEFDALPLTKPRVAIGSFNGPCAFSQSGCGAITDRARILSSLNGSYGDDEMGCDGDGDVYDTVDCITTGPTSGQTDLSTAIDVCQAELDANANPSTPNYIIVITDGIPNIPNNSPCTGFCDCQFARDAAATAADNARAAGTQVFAVHYTGTGAGCSAADDVVAINFLQTEIADDADSYLEGDDGLSQIFTETVDELSCDDMDECTNDTCVDDKCSYTDVPESCGDGCCTGSEDGCSCPQDCGPEVCGDGICNTACEDCSNCPADCGCVNCDEQCVAGTCVADPVDCDDSVACTVDSCDPATGDCVNTPDDSLCDDGNACNGVETCDPINGCQAGTPVDCNDNIDCTTDSCDPNTGQCTNAPVDAACDDGVYCNGTETCDPNNGCQAGTPIDCNDNVSCTNDSCNEDTDQCDNTPEDSNCDDGAYCNGVETCDPTNDCQAGTPIDCNDSVDCTIDSCNEDTDQCDNTPDNSSCDDGNPCNGIETCDPINGCQAGTPPDCNDNIDCTTDSCDPNTGQCVNTPVDSACDNGLFCDGVETCDPLNGCVGGDPVDCNDSVSCTVDSCDEDADQCVNSPQDSLCDNTQFCDGAETCDPINDCQPGTPVDCNDNVSCTNDVCNEMTDSCDNTPDDSNCSNGLFCDGVETCDPTNDCQPGTPVDCDDSVDCTKDNCNEDTDSCDNVATDSNCDDGVACTVDVCDAVNGCSNTPDDSLCDNGLFCDGVETCDPVNGCQSGTPVDCDDSVDCTKDNCNEDTDSCDNVATDSNCDDGVSCTVGSCDAVNGCSNTPDDSLCDNGLFCDGSEICDPINDCQDQPDPCAADLRCDEDNDVCVDCLTDAQCDDGNDCNGAEVCVANMCMAGTPVNCDDGVSCTIDSCNPANGECSNTPDDSICDNGLFCDGTETCDPINDCQAGTPVDCGDGVSCTVDACDEDTDSCTNTPDDSICDNGAFCDGVETCDPNNDCQAGTPVDCGDGVSCTVDACDEDTDSCTNTPDDSICDNGVFCDGSETCDPNNDCQPGTPVNCDDGVSCTTDVCDENAGECSNTPVDSVCDNGQFCDGAETCDPINDCQAGTPVDCNDDVSCTVDACDEMNDTCTNSPNDRLCSDDNGCNGIEVCDPVNDCQPGTPPNCDDGVACTIDNCDPDSGTCDNVPDDSLCDDGNSCNGAEFCDPLNGCQPGLAVNCDDGVGCTVDSCDENTGACINTPDDSLCNNGDFCDGVETCDPVNDCVANNVPDCNDGNDCTVDVCDEVTDSCVSNPNNGLCNDNDDCTLDACTPNGCTNTNQCGACCQEDGSCEDVTLGECLATGESFEGVGTSCEGDNNNNGQDDRCEPPSQVPTVSTWGLLILALMLMVVAKIQPGRRFAQA
ncbi:MAG: hypothetical protein ACPGXK_10380 [Phycisphaerae bacterium]